MALSLKSQPGENKLTGKGRVDRPRVTRLRLIPQVRLCRRNSVCQLRVYRKQLDKEESESSNFLVPLVLTHVPFTQHTILKSAYEIPVALVSTTNSASAAPLIGVSIHVPVWGRGIICRAWLQSNGCVGVQVAGNSLNSGWDSSIGVHRRRPLAASARCRLGIETLGRHLVTWHHSHLMRITWWLGGVWRRRGILLVHAIVYRWASLLGGGGVLVHLRSVGVLRMCCLCCSLFASSLCLLLLLHTGGRLVGS